MYQAQRSSQLYEQVKEFAKRAGIGNVDQFVEEVVEQRINEESGNYDHKFTPEIIAELDRFDAEVEAGAKTYSEEEVVEHFKQKSKIWRSRAS